MKLDFVLIWKVMMHRNVGLELVVVHHPVLLILCHIIDKSNFLLYILGHVADMAGTATTYDRLTCNASSIYTIITLRLLLPPLHLACNPSIDASALLKESIRPGTIHHHHN